MTIITIDTNYLTKDQAIAITEALHDDSDHDETVWALLGEHGECVFVADDGNAEVEFEATETAKEAAEEYVEDGDWGDDSSGFLDVYVWERRRLGDVTADGERESFTIALPVVAPECTESEHDWTSPVEVVGGIKENPGVWVNGGGVIIDEICRHCGALKRTDTWAQHGGIQGLTSVTYEEPGEHVHSEAFEVWCEAESNESTN